MTYAPKEPSAESTTETQTKKTAAKVWQELCSDLNLAPELITIASDIEEDEDQLTIRALLIWEKEEKCEAVIAPILYKLCKILHAPGKKGQGFNGWLKKHGKSQSRSTAYRWITKYADDNGLELPFQKKTFKKTSASLCQMTQGAGVAAKQTRSIPAPSDIGSAKVLLQGFLEKAEPQTRSQWALELVSWIQEAYLGVPCGGKQ